MVDTKNEVDITTDKFQSSVNASGIDQFKLFTRTNLDKNSKTTISDRLANERQETKMTKSNLEAFDEVEFSYRKLREAETQVRSLTLILEQASSGDRKANGMDLEALEQNKAVLEDKIEELKKFISRKELELRPQNNSQEKFTNVVSERSQKDEKTNEESSCLNETGNGQISKKLICNNENLSFPFVETSGIASKVNEWLEGSESTDKSESGLDDLEMVACDETSEYLKEDNARLRRLLSEARHKHKAERNRVIEQLRMLEIEAENGERNWASEVQEKQLKIEELLNKSQELVAKNQELTINLTDCENVRTKESLESEVKTKKKNEVMSQLKVKLTSVQAEKEELEEDLKKLERVLNETEVTVKQLEERQSELKQELCDKNQSIEKGNKESEKYSKEIKETRAELENLVNKVSSLNEDKNTMNEQIETLTNSLENEKFKVMEMGNEKMLLQKECCVDVGLQTLEDAEKKDELQDTKESLENEMKINNELRLQLTEARECVKCWEEKLELNQGEVTELKTTLLQKESTIQELTISLGKSITENDKLSQTKSQFDLKSPKDENNASLMLTRSKPWTNILEIMDKARAELALIQDDVTKHKENVETLGDKWRHYKNSMKEIHQNLVKKS